MTGMRIRKTFSGAVAVPAIAACIALFMALGSPQGASAQELKKISVAMPSASLATALPRLAKDMGMFAKHGLDPQFTTMENAVIAVAALVSGSVDFAVGGPGEMVAAHASGQKILTVATTYGGLAGTVVLAKSVVDKLGVSPKAPIKDRLKALNGLLLASASATAAGTVVLKGAAAKLGEGAEPRFTYLSQQASPAALETGAVQGFTASAPFWIIPVASGTAVVWISTAKRELPSEYSPVASSLLMTMRPYADANPDVVRKIRDTFADFSKAVAERPNDVKVQIGKSFPNLDAKTIDLFFETESDAWRSPPLTAGDMMNDLNFMKVNGLPLPQMDKVDPKGMVYP